MRNQFISREILIKAASLPGSRSSIPNGESQRYMIIILLDVSLSQLLRILIWNQMYQYILMVGELTVDRRSRTSFSDTAAVLE